MIYKLTLWHIPVIYIFMAIAFILPKIPVAGKFFNIINTALHEFGHAAVALLLDGRVRRIELFRDSSGAALTQSDGKVSAFLISMSGYPFAVTVAYIAFYLLRYDAAIPFIIGISLLFVFMLLLWIRNIYGIIWILLFCILNVFLVSLHDSKYADVAALFYAAAMLTESISSVLTLLFLSVKSPQQAGDAANLAKMTHIPAVFWSLLFAAYTGWIVYLVFAKIILP